jgi:hypothetical protein
LAGNPTDESLLFELQDHLMDRRGRRTEEALEIRFRGGTTMHRQVAVDECQVLALFFSESVTHSEYLSPVRTAKLS